MRRARMKGGAGEAHELVDGLRDSSVGSIDRTLRGSS
jgi:hypothetical protein